MRWWPSGATAGRLPEVPGEHGECGWIATLPPPPPARRLASREAAHCVVVGAGFTGLAIARRLATLRPGWRIVLLDRHRAGSGASGRSSGFVVRLAHFVAWMAPEDARRYARLAQLGIDELGSLVTAQRIDCAWDERGWFHVAAREPARRSLNKLRGWLESLGEAGSWMGREAMEAVTGTPYYQAGIRLPGSVLLQPAALARGLAGSLPANVALFEESPIQRIHRGKTFVVETEAGSVTADRLFLATNGALPLLGFLRRRLLPLITYGSLTRTLTPEEQAALGGEAEWGVLAQDPMGSTVRRTRDQRILIRNTVHYRPDLRIPRRLREDAREAHHRALVARFPTLREVALEYTWSGVMGMSRNRAHFFGRLEPGLFAAGGYNGAGIAMGTAAGRLLADLALGADSPDLRAMLDLPGPSWIPPEPLLGLGVRWTLARLNARAEGQR